MEPYDACDASGPFAPAARAFDRLTSALSGAARGDSRHHEVELLIEAEGREVLRLLFQGFLDQREAREREESAREVRGGEGRLRPHREFGHHRSLACVFGTVTVGRVAWRGKSLGNVHPADAELSLPAGLHSHGLRRLAVLEAVRGSYDQAKAAIDRRCGKVMGKRQTERLVVAAAGDIDSFYRQKIPLPATASTALVLQVGDGAVANRPIYVVLAVTCDGHREILGLWAGDGGEGAKYWQNVLAELQNRGVRDVLMLVCDGLKGLPEAVNTVFPATVVQLCIVHLIRTTLKYISRADWDKAARDLKPVYTAANEDEALARLAEFSEKWQAKYPAAVRAWERSWSEVVPFLSFPPPIRKIISTTNAIESLNARYRRSVNACGHFPNETAALKRLYLTTLALDPTGKGRKRWTSRWKEAMNAFDIAFDGRLSAERV